MKKALTILIVLLAFSAHAQDAQVTQKFNNPLFINPALSGNGEKANRLTFLYRDQWRAVIVPYSSTYINYDRKIFENNNNSIGGGIQFFYDKAGDGSLTTVNPSLSLSYSRHFNDKKQQLSAGFQVGYNNRSIDPSSLNFGNQFGINGFDPNTSSGESVENGSLVNLGLGLNLMTKIADRSKLDLGFSIFNPHQPDYSFSPFSNDPRPVRYATYVFAEIFVANQWSLSPNIHFQAQEKTNELHTSLIANYHHNKKESLPIVFSFGAGYRNQDAALTYVGAKIKDVQVGLSFDLNTSAFSDATNTRGGFELSLQYQFGRIKDEVIKVDSILKVDSISIKDILVEDTEIIKQVAETTIDLPIEETAEPVEIIAVRETLPLALFFDNDQPNPNTIITTTNVNYLSSYDAYIQRKEAYSSKIGKEASEKWFGQVKESKDQLEAVIAQLKSLIDKGYKIKMTLQGYTSTLASSDYNEKLAMRRIQSVLLYLKQADSGVLKSAFDNGTIIVKEEPIGESDKNIEDIEQATIDKTISIYGEDAGYERRVEILAVEIIE